MKFKFVVFIGILGIILFCPDSEAISKYISQELYAKYLPKIACYFKHQQQHCSPEDAYFKSQFPDIIGNECSKCDAKTKIKAREEIPIIQKYYPAKFRILLDKYIIPKVYDCLLYDGLCDKKMTFFKEKLPFILKNKKCPGCSDTVRFKIRQRINYLKRRHPKQWWEIETKYLH
ncbi:ejaculatory bulb-specific protein 3-like [Cotesia glomerata]|uniref:Uncharacterized protein n=1 Tax=Cotesia glomerata TaxID=32391 RepID=A0AAV7IGY7_COTGL|nr:ejaculatory bulb-specific protein 3-like [Cotesia glomerata]KAH0550377.1 hypothetical protein KQX54_019066 [Cotesia glomerata]